MIDKLLEGSSVCELAEKLGNVVQDDKELYDLIQNDTIWHWKIRQTLPANTGLRAAILSLSLEKKWREVTGNDLYEVVSGNSLEIDLFTKFEKEITFLKQIEDNDLYQKSIIWKVLSNFNADKWKEEDYIKTIVLFDKILTSNSCEKQNQNKQNRVKNYLKRINLEEIKTNIPLNTSLITIEKNTRVKVYRTIIADMLNTKTD
ncbi:MAG: hypothetical protein Q3960_03015 [Lactobacillus sp.]|nr:hypothetical protein [Lactobacillus sp.]